MQHHSQKAHFSHSDDFVLLVKGHSWVFSFDWAWTHVSRPLGVIYFYITANSFEKHAHYYRNSIIGFIISAREDFPVFIASEAISHMVGRTLSSFSSSYKYLYLYKVKTQVVFLHEMKWVLEMSAIL